MAGFTNKGKAFLLKYLRGVAIPANLYVALVTSATPPSADTNVLGDLTQITPGNGYVDGGFELDTNTTDFDTFTENDTDDRGEVKIKDVAWTAAGGAIPSAGSAARYAVLTDNNATVASREVLFWWDLGSDVQVSDTQVITLQDLEIRITELS